MLIFANLDLQMNISSAVYNKQKKMVFPLKIIVNKTKASFTFQVKPSSRVHAIIIEIAKRMGINHLKSDIQLFKKLARAPMEASSTLKQNGVGPSDIILCHIKQTNTGWTYYSKTHDFETIKEYKRYLPKKYIMPGLNIEAMCVNPDCLNYGEERVIPFGTGEFDMNRIMTTTKCRICPGRDKGIEPPMAIKIVKMVSCYWRYEGHHPDKAGFSGLHFNKGWNKVKNCDEKKFAQLMDKHRWSDIKIYIRGL